MEDVGRPEPAAVEARILSTHSCAASSFHSCTLSMSSPPGSSTRTRAYVPTLPRPSGQASGRLLAAPTPSSRSPGALVEHEWSRARHRHPESEASAVEGGGRVANRRPGRRGSGQAGRARTRAAGLFRRAVRRSMWLQAPLLLLRFPALLLAVGGAIAVLVAAVASGPLFLSSAQNAALEK